MIKSQRGAILVVSLVLLVILTIVGVASLKGLAVNQKMAGNFRDHDLAFQAAEAALVEGERQVSLYEAGGFDQDHFQSSCTGSKCFTSTCQNGFCFTGEFPPQLGGGAGGGNSGNNGGGNSGGGNSGGGNSGGGNSGGSSTTGPGICTRGSATDKLWNLDATWASNAATYSTTLAGIDVSPQFIIEFMCYVTADATNSTPVAPPPYSADWARMYRITAYAQGAVGSSYVMLQSTFKVLQ